MASFAFPTYTSIYNAAANAGGYINVFQTGTTTAIALWADAALTQPLGNPLTLDVNGQATFYVASSPNIRIDAYTSTGILVESIDPVYVVPDLTQQLATNTSFTFGGFVNKGRNGTMDIWQRGTSGTVTTSSTLYTADGFIVGTTGANITWAQQKISSGPAQFGCYYELLLTGAANVSDTFIKQRIESVIAQQLLTGGNVTAQAYIYNNTGQILTPTLSINHAGAKDNFGTTVSDLSGGLFQNIQNGNIQNIAYTFTPNPNSGNGLEVIFDFGTALNTSSSQIGFFAFDIRTTPGIATGQNNTPPIPELRPIPIELEFCQRYLPAFGDIAGIIGTGAGTSAVSSGFGIPFNVPTRIAPTGMTIGTPGDLEVVNFAGTNISALTNLLFSSSNTSNREAFVVAVTSSGISSGLPYALGVVTPSTGNLLFTGAEL